MKLRTVLVPVTAAVAELPLGRHFPAEAPQVCKAHAVKLHDGPAPVMTTLSGRNLFAEDAIRRIAQAPLRAHHEITAVLRGVANRHAEMILTIEGNVVRIHILIQMQLGSLQLSQKRVKGCGIAVHSVIHSFLKAHFTEMMHRRRRMSRVVTKARWSLLRGVLRLLVLAKGGVACVQKVHAVTHVALNAHATVTNRPKRTNHASAKARRNPCAGVLRILVPTRVAAVQLRMVRHRNLLQCSTLA